MTTTQTSRPGRRWFTLMDGHRLRRLRRQHGLSQEQLAAQAGISLPTVARLDLLTELRDAAPCRSRTLGRVARALGEDPCASRPSRTSESLVRCCAHEARN